MSGQKLTRSITVHRPIALRVSLAEAAQTWPKHGFRRPGSGFRYRDDGNYRCDMRSHIASELEDGRVD